MAFTNVADRADADRESGPSGTLPRRHLLLGAGALAAGAAIPLSWAPPAEALADIGRKTVETMDALVALVFPGDDAYSRAQGASREGPGGVAAGGGRDLQRTLDEALPVPIVGTIASLPAAAAIAVIVDFYTVTTVNAPWRPFATRFANCALRDKIRILQRLDQDPIWIGTPIKYAINALPTLAALTAYGEGRLIDRGSTPYAVTAAPPSWQVSGWEGPSAGEPELVSYTFWDQRPGAEGSD